MLKKTFYILITVFVLANLLVVSFWLSLSSESLRKWITYQLNRSVPNRFTFELKSAASHLQGLTLKDLTLGAKQENSILFQIQSLDFDFNPVSLLIFQRVPFQVRLYEGNMDGRLNIFPDLQIDFDGTNIQPNRNQLIRQTNLVLSNPLLELKGTCKLSPPITASIRLNLQRLSITGKMKDTKLPFEIPSTQFSSLDANLEYEDSRLNFTANTKGDITGAVSGNVLINQRNLQRSRLDLKVTSSLSERYQQELGVLLELLNNYKNNAGQLSIRIKGTAQYPKIEKI